MANFQINAGHISRPRIVGAGQIVNVRPAAGATAIVEYTTGTDADVANNAAIWRIWPKGSVTVAASDQLNNAGFIRVTALSGNVSYDIDELPSPSSASAYLTDWKSAIGASGAPSLTGQPVVDGVIKATMPPGVIATLQFTKQLKASPFTKSNIAGAVANAVNTLSYTVQQGDIPYVIGCDASAQVSAAAGLEIVVPPVGPVSGITLIGPTAGIAGQPSNKFYLAAESVTGSATYLASNGTGDTFTPSNPTLTAAVKSAFFTLTQLAVGTSAINITNAGGFENPAAANYVTADSTSSIFTEPWDSATANWTQGANPLQVSGNRLYAGAVVGAGSSMNHSYAIGAGQNMRAVVPVTISASSTTGGLAVGVSSVAAGAAPTTGLGAFYGLYFNFTAGRVESYNNGTVVQLTASTLPRGDYLVTITEDDNYISISADKTDNSVSFFIRRLRTGFNVNNLELFNSDSLNTTGSSVGPMSARKAIQTIEPRTFGEGSTANSLMYVGNAAATIGYAVWFPPAYDSAVAYPLAMMFHGDGSDETAFNSDPTYPLLRKALSAAGYICMSVGIAANKSTWGSQASIDAYFDGWQYIYNKCRITNTVFLGCSMGGIESLNSLSRGKIPGVVAWFGYSPTTNLALAYSTSWTAKINTSYSIAGGNTYVIATAGYDPLLAAPDAFRKLPMMFAAATDDAIVPKANNTDLLVARVTGVAAQVTSIAGITGGHSFVPSGAVLSQMVAFFDAYAK